MKTEEKLRAILTNVLCIDDSQITRAANLIEDLGADEFDKYDIIIAMEEDFQIELKDDDLDGVASFGDLLDVIERLAA